MDDSEQSSPNFEVEFGQNLHSLDTDDGVDNIDPIIKSIINAPRPITRKIISNFIDSFIVIIFNFFSILIDQSTSRYLMNICFFYFKLNK